MWKIAVGIVLAALAAPATAATMNFKVTVGTNEKNGVCYIYLPLDPANEEGPELELSVKASNNNVNVGMSKLASEVVAPRLSHDKVPLTLTLGNGRKIKTDKGYFREGYYYKHVGYWTDEANGAPVLSYLNGGSTFTADFDGLHYGPIPIQQSTPQKNYAYTWLKDCITRNGGKATF